MPRRQPPQPDSQGLVLQHSALRCNRCPSTDRSYEFPGAQGPSKGDSLTPGHRPPQPDSQERGGPGAVERLALQQVSTPTVFVKPGVDKPAGMTMTMTRPLCLVSWFQAFAKPMPAACAQELKSKSRTHATLACPAPLPQPPLARPGGWLALACLVLLQSALRCKDPVHWFRHALVGLVLQSALRCNRRPGPLFKAGCVPSAQVSWRRIGSVAGPARHSWHGPGL